ncbi:MAG: porphobilinogen synthase [Bacteroidota bacterium]
MSTMITERPRRNRKSRVIRNLVRETRVPLSALVYPLFITDGTGIRQPIASMPGIFRWSPDLVMEEIRECIGLGIEAFVLFPAFADDQKDTVASLSADPGNFYLRCIRAIKSEFPNCVVMSDVAMDPYSSDGHDGLVRNGEIVNDETLPILARMAVEQARAGVDIIGPSDMMDGRVGAIREALDEAGFTGVCIMSYTAKYASAFYGPFREALDSAPRSGDKKTYQMDPANRREAIREARLDEDEGADMLMVKPALSYLDVIQTIREHSVLPVAAYNVSGEYAMLRAAGERGWIDYRRAVEEVLLSIHRAGAEIILTYFAKEYATWKRDESH